MRNLPLRTERINMIHSLHPRSIPVPIPTQSALYPHYAIEGVNTPEESSKRRRRTQTLHRRIHITRIPHILQPAHADLATIPIANRMQRRQ